MRPPQSSTARRPNPEAAKNSEAEPLARRVRWTDVANDKQAQDKDDFVRRALIVIALAGLALVAWQLRTVLVLLFGAIVMGTVFRAIAEPLSKYLRLPDGVAVLVAVLVIVGVLVAVGWLLGQQITAQTDALAQTLPRALAQVDDWLGGFGLSHPFQTWLAQLHHSGGTLVSRFGTWLSAASNAIAEPSTIRRAMRHLASSPMSVRLDDTVHPSSLVEL